MDQAGGCKGNAHSIEEEGERDVLDHLAVAPAADLAGNRESIQPIGQNDDVSRLDRDISAAAHSHAYIGLHERGRVIDAVANHRDPRPSLKISHDAGFLLRQYARVHLVYARLASNPPRCALVVARDQDRREPGFAQGGDGLDSIRAERIAQGDKAERAPAPRDANHRSPRFLQRVDPGMKTREIDVTVGEEPRAADQNLTTADACVDALSRKRLEGFYIRGCCAALESRLDHSLSEGVLR